MPAVDVLDDTFVRAAPAAVLAATAPWWTTWLPDLSLRVREDRGVKGVRWDAGSGSGAAALSGTAEVWLEAVGTGTVVHLYVRLDPLPASLAAPAVPAAAPPVRDRPTGRRARDLPDTLRRTWKRGLHRSKDVLEGETQA